MKKPSQTRSSMFIATLARADLDRVRGGQAPPAERTSANTASTAMAPNTLGEAALAGVYSVLL